MATTEKIRKDTVPTSMLPLPPAKRSLSIVSRLTQQPEAELTLSCRSLLRAREPLRN